LIPPYNITTTTLTTLAHHFFPFTPINMPTIDFSVPPPPRVSENSPYSTFNWLTKPTGPKQARKVQPTEGTAATSAAGPAGPDTYNDISDLASVAQSNGGQNQIGMSQLLPGFNNTVERDASFARKPKRQGEDNEEDAEAKKAKVAHGSTGGSGVLGDHLREARKKAAADGAASGTIDLTADDDDEVVITGETAKPKRNPDDESVCIGLLKCRANIHRVPACGNFLGKEHWPKTKITLRRGNSQTSRDAVVELVDKNGTVFGKIAILQADPLSQLLVGSHVSGFRISAWLPTRKRGPSEQVGDAVSHNVAVDAVLYCKFGSTLKVGRYLSTKQLFLSTPTAIENGKEGAMRIVNPQLPQIYQSQQIGASSRPVYGSTTRTVEQITQDVSSMFDSLVTNEQLPEKEANPEIISTPLLPHQKQGLHFLTDHESHDENFQDGQDAAKFSLWRRLTKVTGQDVWQNVITSQELRKKPEPVYGGILADMMGLGKTLSILSLVAATVSDAHAFKIKQPSKELQDKGVNRNAQGTLIVCPTSVLSNWTEQMAAHVRKGKLTYYVYHGPSRIQDVQELAKFDIVFTTYGTVASEWSDALKKKKALASLHWFRIVLDEAHTIRNATTRGSKGAGALHAQRRWAVTGTPVQNRLEDLGALIRFLRIKPFDEPSAWAQWITAPFKLGDENVIPNLRLLVDSITLRRGKENIGLKHRSEVHVKLDFTPEERALYNSFASRSNMQLKGMMRESNVLRGKTYAHVLKSLLRLRMISNHGREMLNEDDLKDLEGMDASNAIDLGDEPEIEAASTKKFISDNEAYQLLKMQADNEMDYCSKCSSKIVGKKASQSIDDDEESSSDEDDDDLMGYLTPCYHLYCPDCKDDLVEKTVPPQLRPDNYHECEVCDTYVRFEFFPLSRSDMLSYAEDHVPGAKRLRRATWNPETYSGPSTKVRALLEELDKSRDETAALAPGEPPIRSVVFTEWTSYLDLLEHALEKAGHTFVRLDGSMAVKQRAQVLIDFKTDPAIAVLLVSIRAGGQGLNFTAANKVYMMEPQYNPGVEQQAIDRVHRLGQKREVEIVHFIMKESVEEALLRLQDKKTKLAKLSMDKKKTKSEEAKKRMEELRELFK
jgi:SNF2 family DNA or RNA helicase